MELSDDAAFDLLAYHSNAEHALRQLAACQVDAQSLAESAPRLADRARMAQDYLDMAAEAVRRALAVLQSEIDQATEEAKKEYGL